MYKKLSSIAATIVIMTMPVLASAHVVVTPAEANVAEELTFNISVPNEKAVPVTNLKLAIPSGVSDVTPTAKDGWTIQTTTSGTGDSAVVTAIVWSDGMIPVGQREDFSFSAQVPAKATDLDWKAYQTYGDGTVVHWDQKPAGSDDADGNAGPYSVTKVNDDLTAAKSTSEAGSSNNTTIVPVVLSLAAIVISVGGILFRKK